MFGRHSFRRRDSRRETVSSKAPRDLNIRKISVSGNSVSSSASFEDGFSSSSSLSSTPSSSFEDHRTPTQHDFIPSGPPPAPPARPTARATIIGTQATRRSTFHKHNPLKSHPSLAEVRTLNHHRESSSSSSRTSSPHQQGSRTSSPAPPRLANRRLLSHCEPQFQGPRRAVTMAAVETAMAMSGSFLYDDTDGEDDLHKQQPPKAVSLPPVMNKRQGFDFGLGGGGSRHNARPRQNTLERLQETRAELEGGGRAEFEEPRPQLSRSHWSQSTLASSVADLDLGNKDDLLVEDDDDDEDDEDDDPEPVTPVISVARPAVLLPNFSYKRPATLATTPQRPSMQAMDGTTPSGRWKRRGVVFNGGLGETAA